MYPWPSVALPTLVDMLRKRAGRQAAPGVPLAQLEGVVERLEEAKASLLSAAPSRRGPGLPLAQALAGFEDGLRGARERMPGWRSPRTEEAWQACHQALELAARRAEHLRLEASPDGYEELYSALGDILDPLDAFEQALADLTRS